MGQTQPRVPQPGQLNKCQERTAVNYAHAHRINHLRALCGRGMLSHEELLRYEQEYERSLTAK